jgi:predicted amidohydrolase YtcJ
MPLAAYEPVRHLARQNELSLRIAFFICAPQAGFERRDFETFLETGFANENTDRFRFLGFGENVVWGMYNNDKPAAADISRLIDVLDWAAQKKLSLTFHWNNAYSVHHLLGAIETIAPRHDLSSLRWSIAHLHDADLPTLQRMKKLELGWLAQNALWWRGSPFLQQRGRDANPALASALRIGLPTGAGTDAHRVMDMNPFAVMQFMISGRTIDGKILREQSESLSRLEALRLYTSGSAWFARQDQQSGMLKPGAFADFAILDKDFLAIPEAEIHTIRAQQTYVGGQKVHEAAR